MTNSPHTTYDDVPYDSQPFPQTHPDRLAVIGQLLSMRCAPPNRCRVLELGCAAGGNLIPLAYALPDSQFVGIDLSRVQIEEGLETIRAVALKNIDLRQLSILDVGADLGKFDYILCHGVYSWIPPPVSRKNLRNLPHTP